MNPKYVFLDIDGTLVGYNAEIPDSAITAIRKAQKNGHKMIIASGRSLGIIYPKLLETISFDGIIASGGAEIIAGEETVFESIISRKDMEFAVGYFRREGIHFVALSGDTLFAEKSFVEDTVPMLFELGFDRKLIEGAWGNPRIVDSILNAEKVQKFLFFFSPHDKEKLSLDLEGRFHITDYSVGKVNTDTLFGEMNLSGVNKATAIERFMEYSGAPIQDTVAIGDSGNDIEMIRLAGVGVAMGNATEEIKYAADFVTTAVDDNGIYNAFLKLGLI